MTSSPLHFSPLAPGRTGRSQDLSSRQAAENELPRPGTAFALGPLHRARCACRRCGVHVITDVGYKVAGNWRNCGGFELVPIADA